MRVDQAPQLRRRPGLEQGDQLAVVILERAVVELRLEDRGHHAVAQEQLALRVDQQWIAGERHELAMEVDRELFRQPHVVLRVRLHLLAVHAAQAVERRQPRHGQHDVDGRALDRGDRLEQEVRLGERGLGHERAAIGLEGDEAVVVQPDQREPDHGATHAQQPREFELVEPAPRREPPIQDRRGDGLPDVLWLHGDGARCSGPCDGVGHFKGTGVSDV